MINLAKIVAKVNSEDDEFNRQMMCLLGIELFEFLRKSNVQAVFLFIKDSCCFRIK